jgi:hypothetical protein
LPQHHAHPSETPIRSRTLTVYGTGLKGTAHITATQRTIAANFVPQKEWPRMNDILVGRNATTAVELDPHFGSRHGMIASATGTGKTISLMVLAEGFPRFGTPVVLADAKCDIARMSQSATSPPGVARA